MAHRKSNLYRKQCQEESIYEQKTEVVDKLVVEFG